MFINFRWMGYVVRWYGARCVKMNKKEKQMQVIMKTSMGDIRMELYEEEALKRWPISWDM